MPTPINIRRSIAMSEKLKQDVALEGQAAETKPDTIDQHGVSRRRFVQVAGAVGLAASVGPYILTGPARAATRTLKILQWSHFVPAYDKWFDNTYTKQWGEKNDTQVIVDHVGIPAINSRAAAEVSAQKGHDLFMFLWPAPSYETQVIDHKEIYDECAKKHGKPIDLAVKSTYNPKTKKYFGFSDSFVPDPVNYRIDLWTEQGMPHGPTSWEDVLHVGKKIKDKRGIPVGIGLSSELDTAMAVRTILYAFGGSVQDEHGKVVVDSPHTRDAVAFVKELYEQTMTAGSDGVGCVVEQPGAAGRQGLAGVERDLDHARCGGQETADRRQARAHAGAEGQRARDRARARDGLLRHLEIRRQHRGREEIPRRLHRQLRAGLQGQRVLQLPVLPHHGARHQGAARERSP